MKTTFRPRNSQRSIVDRKRLIVVGLALAVALLIFLLLRTYILSAVSPLWRAENVVSTAFRNTLNIVRSKESLASENEALKQRLSSFDALAASYRTLVLQEDELLFKYGREGSLPGLAAGVLVHPPETPYDILVIDVGESEGARVGERVSLPEGGVLGVVREVLGSTSKVALYSATGEETQAVLERGDVAVTLRGIGGGTFEIDLPRDVVVAVGDKVLMPGIRAELVGVVEDAGSDSTDSSLRVLVRGVVNVNSIRFVTVH